MTTENPRAEKVAVVAEITAKLQASDAVFITEYRGMSVGQLAGLRRQLKPAGGEYKVYKNTLARLGAAKAGVEGLDDMLLGPSGITFVDGDVAGVAKALAGSNVSIDDLAHHAAPARGHHGRIARQAVGLAGRRGAGHPAGEGRRRDARAGSDERHGAGRDLERLPVAPALRVDREAGAGRGALAGLPTSAANSAPPVRTAVVSPS